MLLSLAFTSPLLFIAILLAIVIALTFHEYAHAYVAYRLGDPTADRMGRMTLNPMSHIDPVGFLMILVAGFGYARPVPFNPLFLRHKKRDPVLIGFAGPAANMIMATVFVLALKYLAPSLGGSNLLVSFLFFAAYINVNLAIFNLIPVPPLDGSKALLVFLQGPKWTNLRIALETRGPIILLTLIIIDSIGGIGLFSRLFNFFGRGYFSLFGVAI